MSKKAAILDTDFTIKTASTKNSKGESLADVVLKLSYTFYCHEQNKKELTDHSRIASRWLEDKINSKAIICMSDLQLLQKIKESYKIAQNTAVRFYSDWLKQACDVFSKSFYETYYSELEKLKSKTDEISDEEFIKVIQVGDLSVGEGKNLGEIKDTVLAITLTQCLRLECINFCSDDNRARRSLLSFSETFPIKSISYMGFYWVSKQKNLLTNVEGAEFIEGYKNFCKSPDLSITIKEHIHRKQPDYPKRNIDVLFNSIWNDEVVMMNDGYLVYKSEISK